MNWKAPTMTNKEDDEMRTFVKDWYRKNGEYKEFVDRTDEVAGVHFANQEIDKLLALIRQSQSTLLRRVGEEVIGEDLHFPTARNSSEQAGRNGLRAEQNARLQAIIKEIEGGE
jgi:DNA phosphorothioation-dependent restriction protein DptG